MGGVQIQQASLTSFSNWLVTTCLLLTSHDSTSYISQPEHVDLTVAKPPQETLLGSPLGPCLISSPLRSWPATSPASSLRLRFHFYPYVILSPPTTLIILSFTLTLTIKEDGFELPELQGAQGLSESGLINACTIIHLLICSLEGR